MFGIAWPHTYLGPVHDVSFDDPEFVAVLVPVPWEPTLLGWLNVWSGARGGDDYAIRVHDLVVEDWLRRGWNNVFLD